MRDASQPTVSRMVSTLTPIVKTVLEVVGPGRGGGYRAGRRRARVPDRRDHHPLLVLQVITPELCCRKHGTTGFNAQLLSLLDGHGDLCLRPVAGQDP